MLVEIGSCIEYCKRIVTVKEIYTKCFYTYAYNTLELPFSSSSAQLFWNIGELGAKSYFTHYWTTNAIQLFVAIKGNFSGLLFFWNAYH